MSWQPESVCMCANGRQLEQIQAQSRGRTHSQNLRLSGFPLLKGDHSIMDTSSFACRKNSTAQRRSGLGHALSELLEALQASIPLSFQSCCSTAHSIHLPCSSQYSPTSRFGKSRYGHPNKVLALSMHRRPTMHQCDLLAAAKMPVNNPHG